jgi:hypothetical protein
VATGVVTEAQIEEEDEKKQTRYIQYGVLCFCVLLIVIVVPVAVITTGKDGVTTKGNITVAPTQAPSSSPTSSTFAELLSVLEIMYDDDELYEELFSDPDSPQSRAASWAADEMPPELELSGSDPRMVSRYALATFYFATNGADWIRCGRDSTNCDDAREWLTGENECNWEAISCIDPDGGDYGVTDIAFRK